MVAIVAVGCGTSASSPEPTASPIPTVAAATASPVQTIDPELGPSLSLPYPSVQAMGIATFRIQTPVAQTGRFWIRCEWSTTERVSWIYAIGQTTLFDELVNPDFSVDSGWVHLWRPSELAPYTSDPGVAPAVQHAPDWTTGTISFDHLRLDPEAWPPGPLPTPKEAYERPLGGNPAATDLSGTLDWACGAMPTTVPTPGPVDTNTPGPTDDSSFLVLPRATLKVAKSAAVGVEGCGASWDIGGVSGGVSCGPSFQLLPAEASMPVPAGGRLTFTLPSGYRFTDWGYQYVDQATAELYRMEEPTGIVDAGRADTITASSVVVAAPPAGEWTVRLTFGATNGTDSVYGEPDYFRVTVP